MNEEKGRLLQDASSSSRQREQRMKANYPPPAFSYAPITDMQIS